MPEQPGAPSSSRFGVEIGRNDRAAPEPVTGWISVGLHTRWSSRQRTRQAGRSNAVTSPRHKASLTQWPECRPV
jgi:hypothetical protein